MKTKDFSFNKELLKEAARGDKKARDTVIEENMGLVKSVVMRFSGRGYENEDLLQIGCIGLIRATEKFDADFGVMFSTYAVPMIIGEIKRFIRDDGIIKVSRVYKTLASKAEQLKQEIIKKTGVEPSIAELAEKLSTTPSELSIAIDSVKTPRSIYERVDDGKSELSALVEKIEDGDCELERLMDKMSIRKLIGELDERERFIIKMRYFNYKTQDEVAKILGISQVQVSRIEKKILLEMRKKLQNE